MWYIDTDGKTKEIPAPFGRTSITHDAVMKYIRKNNLETMMIDTESGFSDNATKMLEETMK